MPQGTAQEPNGRDPAVQRCVLGKPPPPGRNLTYPSASPQHICLAPLWSWAIQIIFHGFIKHETYFLRDFSLLPGWPKLLWFVTESKHLSKPPRDWFPHIKDANNDTAYIEVSPFMDTLRTARLQAAGHSTPDLALWISETKLTAVILFSDVSFQYKTCKDGSVLGVTVTRIALLTHCQALTQACGYTEGARVCGAYQLLRSHGVGRIAPM